MSGGDEPDQAPAGDRAGVRGGLKTFRCGDVVPGCDVDFRGTETQILALVASHAVRDHGLPGDDPAVLSAVRREMRPA